MSKIMIAPSLLSADFGKLTDEIKACEKGGADILHFDVMDGHFVPNITIGPFIAETVKKNTILPLDCHLMVENPDMFTPKFAEAGADYISIHAEATHHLHRSLMLIKSFGIKAGVALNPLTPLEFAFEAAEYCDFILLMSVNPGFGGQTFIDSFFRRVAALKDFLLNNDLGHVLIEIDGGVKKENALEIATAGADILVSGSGVFNGDIQENLKAIISELH
jgi:ribulose-phosphate 3-epimerase